MASKNSPSRADRAVKDANKKATKQTADTKATQSKKKPAQPPEPPVTIPAEIMIPLVCIGLFVLFLIIALKPEGVLIGFFKSLFLGLVGKLGFYVSIPAVLYIFIIYTFTRRTKKKLRGICTVAFTILCGGIAHLISKWGIKLISGFQLFTVL